MTPRSGARGRRGIRAWQAAALDWLRGDELRMLPFGEFGDEVDVIRESARLTLEWARHDRRP
jgi:hypothetical protein